jgi:hypothetical protein
MELRDPWNSRLEYIYALFQRWRRLDRPPAVYRALNANR